MGLRCYWDEESGGKPYYIDPMDGEAYFYDDAEEYAELF